MRCSSRKRPDAAPKADLWPRWEKHDPANKQKVDHSAWDTFLKKYIVAPHPSGINRVNYATVAPEDRTALANYVKSLESVAVSGYSRAEQRAYWINLYNAKTVELILTRFPVKSIRDINISPGLFSSGPWGAKLMTVEGEKLALDDIEHRILRPIWKDNRIHYAVNCASLGCPNFQPAAFTAENTEVLVGARRQGIRQSPARRFAAKWQTQGVEHLRLVSRGFWRQRGRLDGTLGKVCWQDAGRCFAKL